MSFNPKGQEPGKRETPIRSFVADASLMSERTHLPDLDYKKLAMDRLTRIRTGEKAPTGRYATLVAYLGQRGSQVDAAEVDRRLRTWFEDVINKVLADPAEWDADRILNGKALMDFLSGIKGQEPQAPPAAGGQQP